MSLRSERNHELADALRQLEQDVEQPVVPGDEAGWRNQVVGDLELVDRQWRARHRMHEAVFADILEQDMELAARVDTLRATDAALHAELTSLRQRLQGIRVNGAADPAVERALTDARTAATELAARCRTFEGELTTWFTEAYYRDRGAVD